MLKTFTFIVPDAPHPCQRAAPVYGQRRMTDTHDNRRAKKFVAKCVLEKVMEMGGFEAFTGAIHIECVYWIEKPKSKIRKRSTPYPFPDCKPDIDNYLKTTMDGIQRANGIKSQDGIEPEDRIPIIWSDDGQVVSCKAEKRWCVEGMEPMTEVSLVEVVNETNN